MKFLRICCLFLLCAVLPISGLAASGLTGACPMQMSPSADDGATVDMAAMAADMAGCDSMKAPDGVKLKAPFCKATTQCQLGSLYHPVDLPSATRPFGPMTAVTFAYADTLSVRAPDGPWRPPTSL
ncbi:hypothetical protein [Pandoraea norimbergensis]|uniref:Lipoprotein n=1 Tax=Pandoraea norimbergensis TaxID=93219 RepID=A0ABM5WMX6_9BURK|nr:hypothetical protein [Pandoraea norimbergensis]ALS61879.1 hypothetical protein AT302_20935 [Pandoraea norimbergensis]